MAATTSSGSTIVALLVSYLLGRAFGGDEAALDQILSTVANADQLPEAPDGL